jgi:hypothetical protein
MMNSEFNDWNQLLGNSRPRRTFAVLRSAKRLSVDPACSIADQKSAAPEEQQSDDVEPLALVGGPAWVRRTAIRRRRR